MFKLFLKAVGALVFCQYVISPLVLQVIGGTLRLQGRFNTAPGSFVGMLLLLLEASVDVAVVWFLFRNNIWKAIQEYRSQSQ